MTSWLTTTSAEAKTTTRDVVCPSTHTCVTRARRDAAIQAFIDLSGLREKLKASKALNSKIEVLYRERISGWAKRLEERESALRKRRKEDLERLSKSARRDRDAAHSQGLYKGLVIGGGTVLGVAVIVAVVLVFTLKP